MMRSPGRHKAGRDLRSGHWVVIGGTGRFGETQGSGTCSGFAEFGATFTFTGTTS
jgi:hypothetical protein